MNNARYCKYSLGFLIDHQMHLTKLNVGSKVIEILIKMFLKAKAAFIMLGNFEVQLLINRINRGDIISSIHFFLIAVL